jgi:hypothetical protein
MPKGKGGQYERDTCRRLSLWVSDGNRDDLFWRSASSGGQHTTQGNKESQAGDICCTHALGQPFMDMAVIECKHRKYELMEPHKLIFGHEGCKLTHYWRKLVRQSRLLKPRQPVMIFRVNSQPDMVFTSGLMYTGLLAGGPIPLLATFPLERIYAFRFNSLLATNYAKVLSKWGA